jgi:hypothetical protein
MDIFHKFSIESFSVGSALKTGVHLKKCPFDAFNVRISRKNAMPGSDRFKITIVYAYKKNTLICKKKDRKHAA